MNFTGLLKNAPVWKTLVVMHLFGAALLVLLLVLASLNGPSWVGMLDAGLIGINLGLAWGAKMMRRAEQHMAFITEEYRKMCEINEALLTDKVMVEIKNIEALIREPDERRPLH